jgi:hypothetical protein
MLIFAAATQGFFMARSRLWESAVLLLVTFMLLRPGFFLDLVQPPYDAVAPSQIFQAVEQQEDDAVIRLVIEGPDFDNPDRLVSRTMAFELGPKGEPGEARFERAIGLGVNVVGDDVVLDEPLDPNSTAGRALAMLDFYTDPPVRITSVEVAADRMPREIFYIPAIALMLLVVFMQRRRGGTLAGNPQAA